MKILFCAIQLAMLAVLTPAFSQENAPAPQIDQRHYIYIEASADFQVAADRTVISISLSEKRNSADQATKLVSDKIAQFNAALAKLGVTESAIETKRFSFSKVYIIAKDKKGQPVSTWSDPDRDQLDGYRTTYDAEITLGTTAHIGDVLSSASALGIEVTSVTFASSRAEEYREEARRLAAEKAHKRAETYATALGGKLGDLLNVKEGKGYNPDTMTFQELGGEADLMVLDPDTRPMDIAPGKITFWESVSAKWELASSP